MRPTADSARMALAATNRQILRKKQIPRIELRGIFLFYFTATRTAKTILLESLADEAYLHILN